MMTYYVLCGCFPGACRACVVLSCVVNIGYPRSATYCVYPRLASRCTTVLYLTYPILSVLLLLNNYLYFLAISMVRSSGPGAKGKAARAPFGAIPWIFFMYMTRAAFPLPRFA